MTKLKELHVCYDRGIDDNSIRNINLEHLDAYNNTKITRKNCFFKLIDNHILEHMIINTR